MDVADFIAWPGDGTDTRYELVDGVLRAMASASDTHNLIQANLVALIHAHLKRARPSCRVVGNPGIQPRLMADWNFRVPDIGVTCVPNSAAVFMTPDPVLLIEILSPSNIADTRENIRAYATIPTVTELVIVHSTRMKAEVMRRDDKGAWPKDAEIVDRNGVLRLTSIGAEFAMNDIYDATHLLRAEM